MTTNELRTMVRLKKALLEEIRAHLNQLQRKPYFEVRSQARSLENRAEVLTRELEAEFKKRFPGVTNISLDALNRL